MGWLKRRVSKSRADVKVRSEDRELDDALREHLESFIATRKGVEAWVETPTSFNKASILLIAADGEWTRRSVPSTAWAHKLAERHSLPSYDAGVVGYPQRMRDWNARQKRAR
ncbi:MAG TPA: hypothetical protein PKN27_01695 [Propionibacteriaceae bacterium]|nr:hypothetical protein [Propionibacteriaceae bacterium]